MHADAIVLAGGRGTRLGDIDKPALLVGGRSLLARAVDAVAESERVVVVGPHRELHERPDQLLWAREDPAHGGPVAALAAGMAVIERDGAPDSTLVVVLAADMPWVDRADVAVLVDRLAGDESIDAVFATDSGGATQYLYGVWRAEAVRQNLESGGPVSGRSMRSMIPERFATVDIVGTADVDTEADLDRERGTATLSLADARARIRSTLHPLPRRRVPVNASADSVLGETLVATTAFPRFDTSAMDGYAVAGEGPWVLREDVAVAGRSDTEPVAVGTAVRIATGAQLPPGATSVVRDEHVTAAVGHLSLRPNVPVRNDTRPKGEDWSSGASLADAGTPVTPALISTAISAGVETVVVRGPVTVRTIITGNEIRSEGPLDDGQIRDTIGPVLPSYLRSCGFRPEGEVHTLDSETGFDETLRTAVGVDVVVVVGATGGGAADRLRGALHRAGARLVVGSLACRPGGSAVIAVLPDRRVVFGLPGNPYAAVATMLALGPSISGALTGTPSPISRTGVLVDAPPESPATRLVPVAHIGDDRWRSAESTRTAHLAALVGCEGIAVVPPTAVSGDRVEILPVPSR